MVAENQTKKDPVLVVVQLSGGNDFLNTVIPFTNGIYYDVRNYVGHKEGDSLPFTDDLAFIQMLSLLEIFLKKVKWL